MTKDLGSVLSTSYVCQAIYTQQSQPRADDGAHERVVSCHVQGSGPHLQHFRTNNKLQGDTKALNQVQSSTGKLGSGPMKATFVGGKLEKYIDWEKKLGDGCAHF